MVEYETLGDTCHASIAGEMTIYNAAELKQALAPLLEAAQAVELDLSQVGEIDSAGIQLLMLTAAKRASAKQQLKFTAQSDAVTEAFEILGLASYFDALHAKQAN